MYPIMDIEEIVAMLIAAIADENAIVWPRPPTPTCGSALDRCGMGLRAGDSLDVG